VDDAEKGTAVLVEAVVLSHLVDHALGFGANVLGCAFDGGKEITIKLLGPLERVCEVAHRGGQTGTILKETLLDERSHDSLPQMMRADYLRADSESLEKNQSMVNFSIAFRLR
jgi:hypothetical protein